MLLDDSVPLSTGRSSGHAIPEKMPHSAAVTGVGVRLMVMADG